MDQRDRQVIDELFGKLRQVEAQTPQRDRRGRDLHPPAGEPAAGGTLLHGAGDRGAGAGTGEPAARGCRSSSSMRRSARPVAAASCAACSVAASPLRRRASRAMPPRLHPAAGLRPARHDGWRLALGWWPRPAAVAAASLRVPCRRPWASPAACWCRTPSPAPSTRRRGRAASRRTWWTPRATTRPPTRAMRASRTLPTRTPASTPAARVFERRAPGRQPPPSCAYSSARRSDAREGCGRMAGRPASC